MTGRLIHVSRQSRRHLERQTQKTTDILSGVSLIQTAVDRTAVGYKWYPSEKDRLITPSINRNIFRHIFRDPVSGKYRQRVIRDMFPHPTVDDIPTIVEAYCLWRDSPEYVLIQGLNKKTFATKYVGVKCSKRGNDVHARRVSERFAFLNEMADVTFFNMNDFDKHGNPKPGKRLTTRLLYATKTFDSKLCDLDSAWRGSPPPPGKNRGRGGRKPLTKGEVARRGDSYNHNLFMTNLRNRYGNVDCIHNVQAFPGKSGSAYGYPHHHDILFFHDVEFEIEYAELKKGYNGKYYPTYRVKERNEVKDAGKWHSNVDIMGMSSLGSAYRYGIRHLINSSFARSDEADLNNALTWFYGKKSFSVSGDFRQKYHEFIKLLRISKRLDWTKVVQTDLEGNLLTEDAGLWVWRVCGIFSASELGIVGSKSWTNEISSDKISELEKLPGWRLNNV